LRVVVCCPVKPSFHKPFGSSMTLPFRVIERIEAIWPRGGE
jgi:hypothetical protein